MVSPSHRTAIIGGAWTALGFVPFDMWIGRAQPVSAHLVGVLWMVMGVLFLWAPFRYLVAGAPVIDSLQLRGAPNSAGRPAIVLRALTWIASWSVFGVILSMLALMLGYEETLG
jgi:hypothetical protein